MRYELIMWWMAFLKVIPGRIGCFVRNMALPYKKGKNVRVWNGVQIDSPSKLQIGNNVSINRNCVIHAGGQVEIADDVLIGPNVVIYSQNHNFNKNAILIRNQGYSCKKVTIGSNVWLAANVIVLPGVSICNDVVIAAQSVVSKSIEKPGVYGGNPLRFIKKLDE